MKKISSILITIFVHSTAFAEWMGFGDKGFVRDPSTSDFIETVELVVMSCVALVMFWCGYLCYKYVKKENLAKAKIYAIVAVTLPTICAIARAFVPSFKY